MDCVSTGSFPFFLKVRSHCSLMRFCGWNHLSRNPHEQEFCVRVKSSPCRFHSCSVWSSEFVKLTKERYLVWKWLLYDLCFIHHYTIDNGPVFANWNFANVTAPQGWRFPLTLLFQNITLSTFISLCNKMSFTALMYSLGLYGQEDWKCFLSSLELVYLFSWAHDWPGQWQNSYNQNKVHWPSINDRYCNSFSCATISTAHMNT